MFLKTGIFLGVWKDLGENVGSELWRGPTSLNAERSSAHTEGLEMYLRVCAHHAARAATVSAVLSLGSGQLEQPRAERHVSAPHPPGQAELGFPVCVGARQTQCAQLNAATPGCSPRAELLSCSLSKAGSEAPHVIFESVPCVACLTWPPGPPSPILRKVWLQS